MGNTVSSRDQSQTKPGHQRKLSRKYSQIFQKKKSLLSSKNSTCSHNNIQSCESFNRLKQILTHYYKYIEEQNKCYKPRFSLVSQQSVPNGHEYNETVGVPASLLELTTNVSMPELEAPQMQPSIEEILAKDAERKEENKSKNTERIYEYINNKFEKGSYSNIALLNDFNHCLIEHGLNDNAFEYMYNNLISLICKECDINSCLILRRNYRNRMNIFDDKRDELYFGFNDAKEINIQQILDKIHCFYYHSYDLGFRLNTNYKFKTNKKRDVFNIYEFLVEDLNENKEIDDEKIPNSPSQNSESNEDEFEHKNENLLNLRDILLNKMKKSVSIRSHLRFNKRNNRYFSDNIGNKERNPRYYYWEYYKQKEDDDKYNNGYSYKDWYIPSRFKSIKHELINNDLNICHYNDLYEKASNYIETEMVKKLLCNVSIWETSYEIKIGTLISLQQIISIILYTSFDSFRRKFIQTFFYKSEDESKKSLIKRHCHYANLGRLLREVCECFGVQTKNSKINIFYHGITYNVSVENVLVIIKYPFSTSLNKETILNYILPGDNDDNDDNDNGLVLKLTGDISGYSTYFNCCFLSDFVNEYELFFIGGLWPLMYKNIISINNGENLKIYLYSIHVINQMLNGVYYQLNINIKYWNKIQNIVIKLMNHQLYKQYNAYNAYNDEEKEKEEEDDDFIDEEEEIAKRQKIQKIARRPSSKAFKRSSFKPPQKALPALPLHLQNNIMNKNSDSDDDETHESDEDDKKKKNSNAKSKMKNKYKKFENIPIYIEKMMDRYCNKLEEINLDYMRMNKEKSKSMPSYLGYKFCGDLFCLYKIEWFKLPIILKLFPNLKYIQVFGNIELNTKILDYCLIILVNEINKIIKQYNISKTNLKKANEILKLKSITIDEPDEETLTIGKAVKKYTNKFKKIKWKMYEDDQQLIITSQHIIKEED